MLGKQDINTDLFQCVTMEGLVPPNHVLRRLYAALDLGFVRERVACVYSPLGRHSVDPEVVVRIWILQHFYGLSEREVCDEVQMHAGFRWFCGLSFNDPVPDQSTLVKLRNHKWTQTGLWEALLKETVRACEAAGIARPSRMGLDGTQITANAATASLEVIPPTLELADCVPQAVGVAEEDPPPEALAPVLTVEEGEGCSPSRKSGDPDWHGEHFSNKTHRSRTDPEARLYRKGPAQEAKLRFMGHYLADIRSGVVYGACATQATGTAEREAGLALLDGLHSAPDELAMDLGYRDGEFLAHVIERKIKPLVPIGAEPLEAEPAYQRKTHSLHIARKRQQKQAAARARNLARAASRGQGGVTAQRQRTRLEHLYGEAKEHHGLGRAQGRGVNRLDKQVKLTASVQNMKRLLTSRRPKAVAMRMLSIHSSSLIAMKNKRRKARWSSRLRSIGIPLTHRTIRHIRRYGKLEPGPPSRKPHYSSRF